MGYSPRVSGKIRPSPLQWAAIGVPVAGRRRLQQTWGFRLRNLGASADFRRHACRLAVGASFLLCPYWNMRIWERDRRDGADTEGEASDARHPALLQLQFKYDIV